LKKQTRLTDPWQTWLKWGEKKPKSVKSEMQRWDNNSTMEIQGIIRDYFENMYSNKFENL
jgi:hypothetical protein